MIDSNVYMVVDMVTFEKVASALHLARKMAEKSYPHLVDTIDFAIDQMRNNTETFSGSHNKPRTKKAYRK